MKRMTVFVLAGIITCIVASPGFAKEPGEFVEEFFGYIKAGKVSQGYDMG